MITSTLNPFKTLLLCAFILGLLVTVQSPARVGMVGDPTWSMREKINRKLGYGFSTMPMGSYKPLGGYPGLEIGVDYHHIDMSELKTLNYIRGSADLDFMAFTLSKGLYYDIDFRLSASFLPQNNDLQYFSGMVRWNFYDNPKWLRLTAETYLSGVTIVTDVIPGTSPTATRSSYAVYGSGYGVVASRSFGRFETFAGIGRARAISHFIVSERQLNQDDTETRYTGGGGYDFGIGKITGGLDQIEQTKMFVQLQFILQ